MDTGITFQEADIIISKYGEALAANTASAKPRTSLPYTEDQITEAIKLALVVAVSKNDLHDIELLKTGYVNLAIFVSDEDAILVRDYEEMISSPMPVEDSQRKEFLRKMSEYQGVVDIGYDIVNEMQKRQVVVNEFVERVTRDLTEK